jgi:TRAP-type mannitol/chloroaromatic compound transport system permease large subunit
MMKVVSTPSTRSSSVKPLALQSLALIFGGEYACVGEVIELGVSVSAMLGGVMLPGMLFITQYRTAFVCSKTLANPKRTQSLSTSQFDVAIPHGTIHKFYRQDDPEFLKDKAASILTIRNPIFFFPAQSILIVIRDAYFRETDHRFFETR